MLTYPLVRTPACSGFTSPGIGDWLPMGIHHLANGLYKLFRTIDAQ